MSGGPRVEPLALPGVLRLHQPVHRDPRGFFQELGRAEELEALGIGPFVQDNHSRSARGVLRGLHFQRRQPQGKLLVVLRGRVLDVVADVQPGSPTFGRHLAIEMQAGDGTRLWIPPGYAHGFLARSDQADVLYRCTAAYAPGDGRGIRWDCPRLAIPWGVRAPILSPADAAWPTLDRADPEDLPPPVRG